MRESIVDLNYIFIRIPKTASTSIVRALNRPIEHITAKEWKKDVGDKVWKERFTFSVVRDPYTRFLSMYYFFALFSARMNVDVNDFLIKHDIEDFRDHVDFQFIRPQADYLYDGDELLVDYVGRFEDIDNSWREICTKIGRKCEPLPKLRRRQMIYTGNDCDTPLTEISKEKIYAFYKRDFELLDYKK